MRAEWTGAKRLVVKIGSSLLVDSKSGALKAQWLASLCDDIAKLKAQGKDVIVVSSGAIALGRNVLKLPKGALKLEDSQAAAAVGQIALAHAYEDEFRARGMVAAQVLLTLGDTEERRRYLNARNTVTTLLSLGAVPVVNENDTVATSEIRYGDNDRLAARVASMMSATASCCSPMWTASTRRHQAPRRQRAGSTKSVTSRLRSRPWPAMSAQSCHAAAW
jgi:glutamate 5-kinase